ncbi:hypothetical protein CYL18_14285 [Pradoshia eiseniae]|uniref:Uncharacterized protein n=1 Tax=Pradoshia eiseniae TaxID=2064768 RepID=A0A2S7MX26_9BACI|nr:hypothetical protein [Pradoshia eiseniae]PQD94381.1 hypothetical protein CYL18_14285 [Pradoshia eiseniae]
MLVNGRPEELVKYSKGPYYKEKFLQVVKERWELTDLQIRMTYLVSDLALNAEGVFSITHQNFLRMFEERFRMEVSLSSVRRFFGLLSKIEVLSIHHAKRKNNQQSANIYIVNVSQEGEQLNEHPSDTPVEQPVEQHNKTINNIFNKPLTDFNCNFKEAISPARFKALLINACQQFYREFSIGRYSKKQWITLIEKFATDTIESDRYRNVPIHNMKGYAYQSLKIITANSDYKHSDDFDDYQKVMNELGQGKNNRYTLDSNSKLYDWISH